MKAYLLLQRSATGETEALKMIGPKFIAVSVLKTRDPSSLEKLLMCRLIFYVCVSVSVCTCRCPRRPEEGVRIPRKES